MVPSLSPKDLQYGPREILLLFTAIAFLIGGSVHLYQCVWSYDALEIYLYIFPSIVGILFYINGCSIRNRTSERSLNCSTKVISILIVLITGMLLLYVLWAKYRIRSNGFYIQPYQICIHPDQMILWLNDYYDKKFPAYPGGFKMHAEFPRVAMTIMLLIAPLAGIIGWRLGLLLPINKEHIYRLMERIKRLQRL